jgi:hypothetical protein
MCVHDCLHCRRIDRVPLQIFLQFKIRKHVLRKVYYVMPLEWGIGIFSWKVYIFRLS